MKTMRIKKGNLVTCTELYQYSETNNEALMLLVDKRKGYTEDVKVIIVGHNSYANKIGNGYWVNSRYFRRCTMEEFLEMYPNPAAIVTEEELRNLADDYHVTLNMEDTTPEPYVLSDEQRVELMNEMRTLLEEYDYHPTDVGLNAILDEWLKEKGWLIRLFEKHPNYNGKFQIAFDYDFDRNIDMDAVSDFRSYLMGSKVTNIFKKEVKIGAFTYEELYNMIKRTQNMIDVFDANSKIYTVNGHNYAYYRKDIERFRFNRSKYEENADVRIDGRKAYDKIGRAHV